MEDFGVLRVSEEASPTSGELTTLVHGKRGTLGRHPTWIKAGTKYQAPSR